MTRCAGSQGTGFACMVAGMQEPLDAARSVCAVVSALAGESPAPAASHGDSLASGTPRGERTPVTPKSPQRHGTWMASLR